MYTHMDRTIFHLKASVPATSLYILICSLLDEGQPPTLDRTRELWNGTDEELAKAVEELTRRGILEPAQRLAGNNNNSSRLNLTSNWRRIV